MLRTRSVVRKNRRGNIVKSTHEHYLRNDILCGVRRCHKCYESTRFASSHKDRMSDDEDDEDEDLDDFDEGASQTHRDQHEGIEISLATFGAPDESELERAVLSGEGPILVPDTNVIIHQIDLCEDDALKDVVISQTVLEEVRHLSMQTYRRLRTIIADRERRWFVFLNEHHPTTYCERERRETPNDRNDRAIRQTAVYYKKHLRDNGFANAEVLLVTNDAANLHKAKTEDNLQAQTIHKYVSSISKQYPHLPDLLAHADDDQSDDEGDVGALQRRKNKKAALYDDYLSTKQINEGLRERHLYQGKIQINRHNAREGYVLLSDGVMDDEGLENADSILVSGRNLNRAMQGDIVVVEMLDKADWHGPSTHLTVDSSAPSQTDKNDEEENDENAVVENLKPCGKVVGIVRRDWRPVTGVLQPPKYDIDGKAGAGLTHSLLFVCVDKRVPKIRIRTRQPQELLNKKLVVQIDGWPAHSRYPNGHYIKVLGQAGDREVESEAVLIQHGIHYWPFSQAVLDCLPPDDWKITEEEIARRTDLRHLNVCSIDPPGCTDIDDALHCRPLENGNFEVGVHIADVTHFVKPNTPMDDEAVERGVTVYLTDRRIDMLPPLLGTNLCSLHGGQERLAFSALWEMTPDAEIVGVDFKKTVILSRQAFTYAEAQARVDDETQQDDLSRDIRQLLKFAKILKNRRTQRGALVLASIAVKFTRDSETQDPVNMELYQTQETNSLVEEFMLLANISVAERILAAYPSFALLRRHPPPPPHSFDALGQAVAEVGFEIDASSSSTLAKSLDRAVLPSDPYFNTLVRIMSTRCMSQAVYFASGTLQLSDYNHYGLAAPIYTHFTSPIRRYADVIVHRLLAASIGFAPIEAGTNTQKVRAICDGINRCHLQAQRASRDSVSLYTLLFFKNKKPTEEDAYITKVKANGFIAVVPRYGFEHAVGVDHETLGLVYDEEKQTMKTRKDGLVVFRVFQKVRVLIRVEVPEDAISAAGVGQSNRLVVSCLTPDMSKITTPTAMFEYAKENPLQLLVGLKERIAETARVAPKRKEMDQGDASAKRKKSRGNR